jgi:hypothetical protein
VPGSKATTHRLLETNIVPNLMAFQGLDRENKSRCGWSGITGLDGLAFHPEKTANGIPTTARSPRVTSIIERVYRIPFPCNKSRITALAKTIASSSSADIIDPAFSRRWPSSWIENR